MQTIFNEFKTKRAIDLSLDEFNILVLTYPIFKVANADGIFDNEETLLLTEIIINFLSEIYGETLSESDKTELAQLYIEDLLFINSNKQQFDLSFLDSLSNFPVEIKKSIAHLLLEIAEVSGGLDKEENEMIETLTKNYLS